MLPSVLYPVTKLVTILNWILHISNNILLCVHLRSSHNCFVRKNPSEIYLNVGGRYLISGVHRLCCFRIAKTAADYLGPLTLIDVCLLWLLCRLQPEIYCTQFSIDKKMQYSTPHSEHQNWFLQRFWNYQYKHFILKISHSTWPDNTTIELYVVITWIAESIQ